MNPLDAVREYVTDCRARNLSPNSVKSYDYALRTFIHHLPQTPLSQMIPSEIDAAWAALSQVESISVNSRRTFRVIITRWLDWCVLYAGLPSHTLRKTMLPKRTAPWRPKVTLQRIYALRLACDSLTSHYVQARALAMIEVLWSTLIRKEELLQLRVCHLRLEEDPPKLLVECGKGGWTGWVSMSDKAASALRAWLLVRGEAPHDWLWCNEGEKRLHMSDKLLYGVLSELAVLAQISAEDCKPHALRRGGATAMLQEGIDIATVSQRLRHKSIQTTWDYVGADQKRADDCRNWEEDVNRAKSEERDLKAAISEIRSYLAQGNRIGVPGVPAVAQVPDRTDPRIIKNPRRAPRRLYRSASAATQIAKPVIIRRQDKPANR